MTPQEEAHVQVLLDLAEAGSEDTVLFSNQEIDSLYWAAKTIRELKGQPFADHWKPVPDNG